MLSRAGLAGLVVLVGCSDPPSSMSMSVGGCDGALTVEKDTTAEHVPEGTSIEWTNNPPTSGPHFPIWAAWNRQYAALPRGNWLHNAEHGGVILLYHCDPACPDVVDALLAVARAVPADPKCSASDAKRVILTGDSDLPVGVQVAAVTWNHAYTASCYDDYVATFAADNYGSGPEDFCSPGANLGGTPIGP